MRTLAASAATPDSQPFAPFVQLQALSAPDPLTDANFGGAIAVSGNTVVIGAPGGGATRAGQAYVYTRAGGAWTLQQTLTAPDASVGARFGEAVAIEGDTAIVGTHGVGAYVFTRSGATWTERQKLTPEDGVRSNRFSSTVAISGGTVLVGDWGRDSETGVVDVFTGSGSSWTQQQQLADPAAAAGDRFGVSLAMTGSAILVGTTGVASVGAAYAYAFSDGAWTLTQTLTSGDAADFGWSVALEGDLALIGAINTNASWGAAYIFRLTDGVWTEEQEIGASDPGNFSFFGASVALTGGTALVGQFGRRNGDGAVYVFTHDVTGWNQQQKIVDPQPFNPVAPADGFGQIMAASGTTAVIGSALRTLGAGAAFVFAQGAGQITVSTAGPGTITSSPAGISCPGTCTHVFPVGTSVTLDATPDPQGTAFLLEWVGCDATPTRDRCTIGAGASPATILAPFATLSAAISASPDHSVVGSQEVRVQFDACGSFLDPSRTFVYDWTVGTLPLITVPSCDGARAGGYAVNLVPGDYPVTLTVRSDDGALSASAGATLQVRPFAGFSWADETVPDPGQTTVPVDVDACSSGGVVSYRWITPVSDTTTTACRTVLDLPVGNVDIRLIGTDVSGAFTVQVAQSIRVVASTGAPCPTFAFGPDSCWRQGAGWFGDAFSGPTRNPDYAMLSISAGAGVASLSTTFVLTCDGNSYASDSLDLSVGLGGLPVSGTVSFGYVGSVTGAPPTMADIDSYVQNEDASLSFGAGAGARFTYASDAQGPKVGVEYWRGGDVELAASLSQDIWSNAGPDNRTPSPSEVCTNGVTDAGPWLATHDIPITPNSGGDPVADLVAGTTPTVDGGFYVSAGGFASDSAVSITLHTTEYHLATVAADIDGNVGVPLALPDGIAAGDHTLIATGIAPGGAPLVESTTIHVPGTGAVDTTTTVSSSADPAVVGQSLTYTAQVAPDPTADPSGEVAFSDDGSPIAGCQHRAVQTGGSATCSVSYGAPGVHTIGAEFAGTAGFSRSSGSLSQTVSRASTTTSLTFGSSSSSFGAPTTIRATVSVVAPGSATPTGTVTFLVGGSTLGQASLVGGTASIVALLQAGSQTIRAVYAGDADVEGSSRTVTRAVGCTTSLSAKVTGSLTVGTGRSLCLLSKVTVKGSVKVNPGGALFVAGGSTISGSISSSGAAAVTICASSVTGGVTIAGTTGFVLIGDGGDNASPGCGGDLISSSVSLTGNRGGVEIGGDRIKGSLSLKTSTIATAPPYTSIIEDLVAPEIEANVITKGLVCVSNVPAPVNDGLANTVKGAKTGQCTGL